MKTHNTTSPPRLIALLAGAVMLGLVSQTALAAGTASGTTISNLAKLSYSVGGTAQQEICSSSTGNSTGNGGTSGTTCTDGVNGAGNTSFVVDNKVNLTVAKVADANVIPGTTKQALAFTVTNNGNTSQRYALSVVNGAETFTTNIAGTSIYLDVNANNAWDGGDTLYVDASTFGNVAANGSLKILIVADIPAPQTNGQTAVFNLLAQTVDSGTTNVTTETAGANTAGVDVVFADIAGSAGAGTDDARDGKHSVSATYTIATSAITVTKTVSVLCDPYNIDTNPKNIPGAITKWTIKVANGAGGSDATLTTVVDTLVATLVHDANLITGAGTCTSAGGTPESAANKGFRVNTNANRAIGTCANTQAFCYFTTNTADGLDIAGQVITATFATILPVDAGTGHGSEGLLKANEWVEVIFNTTVQ